MAPRVPPPRRARHAALNRRDANARYRSVARPPDVICFCGQDWWYHNRAHSDFQLMTRAARSRRVLLVNSIGMRMPMPGRSPLPFRRLGKKLLSMLRHVRKPLRDRPDFTVMTPVLFPFYGSARARACNARLIRWQVERAAKRLGMDAPHIVVTVPTAWDVAKDMRRSSLVYNRSDKHSAFGEADASVIGGLERELLTRADLVLYSSRAFLAAERELTGDRARFLDHGVDRAHFAAPRPSGALTGLVPTGLGCRRPIVGFFGGLDDYVIDFDLLERLAVERPGYTLVLIGDATLPLDRLTRHPNVRWLGFRPYAEIPALGADFDVAIMPWLDNEWIRCCNPVKLKEYLALGLEVVTTPFPEVEHYRDFVHVAERGEDFLRRIDAVVQGARAPGDRTALLARAGWDDRADELLALLDGAASAPAPEEAACAVS
jgi:glycosyltransferase involved in cell wall biosynthesis